MNDKCGGVDACMRFCKQRKRTNEMTCFEENDICNNDCASVVIEDASLCSYLFCAADLSTGVRCRPRLLLPRQHCRHSRYKECFLAFFSRTPTPPFATCWVRERGFSASAPWVCCSLRTLHGKCFSSSLPSSFRYSRLVCLEFRIATRSLYVQGHILTRAFLQSVLLHFLSNTLELRETRGEQPPYNRTHRKENKLVCRFSSSHRHDCLHRCSSLSCSAVLNSIIAGGGDSLPPSLAIPSFLSSSSSSSSLLSETSARRVCTASPSAGVDEPPPFCLRRARACLCPPRHSGSSSAMPASPSPSCSMAHSSPFEPSSSFSLPLGSCPLSCSSALSESLLLSSFSSSLKLVRTSTPGAAGKRAFRAARRHAAGLLCVWSSEKMPGGMRRGARTSAASRDEESGEDVEEDEVGGRGDAEGASEGSTGEICGAVGCCSCWSSKIPSARSYVTEGGDIERYHKAHHDTTDHGNMWLSSTLLFFIQIFNIKV